jgi:hypothetical protein
MKLLRTLLAIAFALSLQTAFAEAAPTKAPIQLFEMERDFHRLGIPTGKIDGVIDGQTQRALCVWRELTGREMNRSLLPTLIFKISR